MGFDLKLNHTVVWAKTEVAIKVLNNQENMNI